MYKTKYTILFIVDCCCGIYFVVSIFYGGVRHGAVFRVACVPWTIRNEVERIVNEYWIEIGRFIFLLFENDLLRFSLIYPLHLWGMKNRRIRIGLYNLILHDFVKYPPHCLFNSIVENLL